MSGIALTNKRFKLTISYDGTHYFGWQVQPNGTAIQPLIQKALTTALRTPTLLTGASRTDAGVHALGQTAHFDATSSICPSRLKISLNALLPLDIRILQIDPVADDFHARYHATSKIYHYHIHLDKILDPFIRLYRHQVFTSCDLSRIRAAIPHFLGTLDFLSFANQPNRGSASRGSIRTLFRLDLIEQNGGFCLEFEGDGFLYKMVRNIVAVLLDVGSSKLEPSDIPAIFAAKDRKKASFAAPPVGLFLIRVNYP